MSFTQTTDKQKIRRNSFQDSRQDPSDPLSAHHPSSELHDNQPSQPFTSKEEIQTRIDAMRAFYCAGSTQPLEYRRGTLEALRCYLKKHEAEALEALKKDLGKSFAEGYATELGIIYEEIRLCLSKMYAWAKPRHVFTPLAHFPATSKVYPSPRGIVAIFSPWNYPLQLAIVPLIDALIAGNCVVIKASRNAPHTNAFMQTLCDNVFDPNLVCFVPGGPHINDWMLHIPFDKIFFTGSPRVGRHIMQAAATHITDVTLELGGKSPCIVAEDANITRAAQRIAWGKCLNAGQTCVAPDYLLVHKNVADDLVVQLDHFVHHYYGANILSNEDYPRLINEHHFDRVCSLIDEINPESSIAFGGKRDRNTLRIEPTVIQGVTLEDPIMNEEIFGPVLPLITWETFEELNDIISSFPPPLACYIFSSNTVLQQRIIHAFPFGGATINDVVIHLANNHMGFGGVGQSGIGAYHGKAGFDCFTHYKSTLKRSTLIETPFRYLPSSAMKMRIMRLFLR